MTVFKSLLVALALLLPLNSQAIIITDTIPVHKQLELRGYNFYFDLAQHGYNHVTDTINYIVLIYDFSKSVDPIDDFENFDTLETIQLNSYLFDGRSNFHDINPGLIQQGLSWTKNIDYCQKENYDTGECEFNLDLKGNAREFLGVYSGSIWLSDVKFSVDVTRVSVSEPSTIILLLLGLAMIIGGRKVQQFNKYNLVQV